MSRFRLDELLHETLDREPLRALLDRAADLGGTFEVRRVDDGVTAVEWRVPLTG